MRWWCRSIHEPRRRTQASADRTSRSPSPPPTLRRTGQASDALPADARLAHLIVTRYSGMAGHGRYPGRRHRTAIVARLAAGRGARRLLPRAAGAGLDDALAASDIERNVSTTQPARELAPYFSASTTGAAQRLRRTPCQPDAQRSLPAPCGATARLKTSCCR